MPSSKVIQVAATDTEIVVLREDGSIWIRSMNCSWQKVKDLPNDKGEKDESAADRTK